MNEIDEIVARAPTSSAHPTVTASVSVRYTRVTVGIDAYPVSYTHLTLPTIYSV